MTEISLEWITFIFNDSTVDRLDLRWISAHLNDGKRVGDKHRHEVTCRYGGDAKGRYGIMSTRRTGDVDTGESNDAML